MKALRLVFLCAIVCFALISLQLVAQVPHARVILLRRKAAGRDPSVEPRVANEPARDPATMIPQRVSDTNVVVPTPTDETPRRHVDDVQVDTQNEKTTDVRQKSTDEREPEDDTSLPRSADLTANCLPAGPEPHLPLLFGVASFHDGEVVSVRVARATNAASNDGQQTQKWEPVAGEEDVIVLNEAENADRLRVTGVPTPEQPLHRTVYARPATRGLSKRALSALPHVSCHTADSESRLSSVLRYHYHAGHAKHAKTTRFVDLVRTRPNEGDDEGTHIELRFSHVVRFFGMAMRGDSVELPVGSPITLKNLDINHYALSPTLGLYGSVPFVHAVDGTAPEASALGIFWMNGSPTEVTTSNTDKIPSVEDDNNNDAVDDHEVESGKRKHEGPGSVLSLRSSHGPGRLFFIQGPTVGDVLRRYYAITGAPALPPFFGLGYHQCRWNYLNQDDMLQVNQGFDDHRVPCDTIWLDIEHTDDKRYFTWDRNKFPDPAGMQNTIWDTSGRRTVTISDPHIKVDPNYHVWREANSQGFFVKKAHEDTDFTGHCWPGQSSWLDFTNPAARAWYATLFTRYDGATKHLFTWNDMNEPSVFSGPQTTMPMDAMHHNNVPHGRVHQLYGFYHTMATAAGHVVRSGGTERPFLLSRSFFAGSQRFAAIWTGDNQARWDHLRVSVAMIAQMSLSGIPFCGADVGGFFDDPERELLERWYQLGVVYPFFRGHSHEQTPRREPWLRGEETLAKIRAAIRLRYMLLPFLYTVFWRAATAGDAVLRPLMLEFPWDAAGYSVSSTFLVGSDLLVAPILDRNVHDVDVFVPARERSDPESPEVPVMFYEWFTGTPLCTVFAAGKRTAPWRESDVVGGEAGAAPDRVPLPLFIRAGSIVPVKTDVGKSTEDHERFPYRLVVALDEAGEANGQMYLDDGVSNRFSAAGERCVVYFSFANGALSAQTFPSSKEATRSGSLLGRQSAIQHGCNLPAVLAQLFVLDSARIIFYPSSREEGSGTFTTVKLQAADLSAIRVDDRASQAAAFGDIARMDRSAALRVKLVIEKETERRKNIVIEVSNLRLHVVPSSMRDAPCAPRCTAWRIELTRP